MYKINVKPNDISKISFNSTYSQSKFNSNTDRCKPSIDNPTIEKLSFK